MLIELILYQRIGLNKSHKWLELQASFLMLSFLKRCRLSGIASGTTLAQ